MLRKVAFVFAATLMTATVGSFGASQPADAACSSLDPGEACCDTGPKIDPVDPCYDADYAASQARRAWMEWIPAVVSVILVVVLALCIRAMYSMGRRGTNPG